jgi:hypothetical protein
VLACNQALAPGVSPRVRAGDGNAGEPEVRPCYDYDGFYSLLGAFQDVYDFVTCDQVLCNVPNGLFSSSRRAGRATTGSRGGARPSEHERPATALSQVSIMLHRRGFRRTTPGQGDQLTVLAVEVLAECRGTLLPDPKHDAVRCITMMVSAR